METKPTLIIAEAGVNHNGSVKIAKQLIDVASEAKVDAIKFQTFISTDVITTTAPHAPYQKNSSEHSSTQLEMVKRLELDFDDFIHLKQYAEKKGLIFLSTPFDSRSIAFLASLNLAAMKIPSGEITNLPYLRQIGKLNMKVFLSTGMATISEIQQCIDVLTLSGTELGKIFVLHCNTAYPTPVSDINLRVLLQFRKLFGPRIGFSDHSLGVEAPIAAVALGAKVIEKHFTLDKALPGPDHKASLLPGELRTMVQSIRFIEQALGGSAKTVTDSEKENIPIARKSIVAKRRISAGEVFSEDSLTTKRPGTGLSPMLWDELIGTTADRNYGPDDLISGESLSKA